MTDLAERCTEYLSSGGLFNPEMMEHDKVRDLIIDCRNEVEGLDEEISDLKRALRIAAGLISTMNGYSDRHPEHVYDWLLEEGSVNE